MPRTNLSKHIEELMKPPIPEPLYLAELFRRYARAYHMSFDDIGKQYGCTGANISAMMLRPTELWRLGEIEKICKILHVDVSEALRAAQLRL